MEKKRQFESDRSESKSLSLLYQQSLKHRDRGDISQALSCLEEGLLTAFGRDYSKASERGILAESWIEYGKLLRQNNQHAKAIYAFEQAIAFAGHELDALTEWGDLLHEQGYSDEIIAERMNRKLEHSQNRSEILVEILCRLGAFQTAFTYLKADPTLNNERMLQLHTECLIRSGLLDQAINYASNAIDAGQLRPAFTDPLAMDTLLCRWILGEEDYSAAQNRQLLSESLKRAVNLGLHELANNIAGEDIYLQNELTLRLYYEGYTELAKARLRRHSPVISLNYSEPLHKDLAYIQAEIEYDEGAYDTAAQIFESLIDKDPLTATYRFAAASCYLKKSYQEMEERLSLNSRDLLGIQKAQHYMETIIQSLYIVERSRWHTVWTPAQLRNKCLPPSVRLS
ncbi:tetratricopeptide repeat protein [Paenibacillus zeisoli]|uniref:tetratricopeptide repeat protein n=1 Tax=Paenibacillus zeisoli TaxID=2496267 RepID=UPI00163D2A1D|nr:tetratricopeptide repeat protein [Paenibacillus zeisoli]